MSIIEKTRNILKDHPDALAHYDQILKEQEVLKKRLTDYISTTDASQLLGISVPTVRNLAKAGSLSYILIGRHMRLDRKEVEAYLGRIKIKRKEGMDELTDLSEEMGLYE